MKYISGCHKLYISVSNPNSLLQVARHLATAYGDKAFDVAKMARVTGQRWPIVGKRLVSEFPYIEAEVKPFLRLGSFRFHVLEVSRDLVVLPQVLYAIKEYACTAIDVLARRTRLGFLNVQAADEALPRIVQIMGKELNWSQEKRTVWDMRWRGDVHFDSLISFRLKEVLSLM